MNFWAFLTSFYSNPDMIICNFFDVYVFTLWRTAHFLYFSRGRQNSALIAIHMTSAGSISFFNSWLRCYRIV